MVYPVVTSTDVWLPVVLLDDTDGKTTETSVAYCDITVKYYKADGSDTLHTYSVGAGDWHEKGEGMYALQIGASEFTSAAFWEVSVAASGSRTHRIPVYATAAALATVGANMNLADDAITAAKFDESTAFPVESADTGATQIARVGADGDTLETLSDQLDGAATASALATHDGKLDVVDANVDTVLVDTDITIPGTLSTIADYIDTEVAAIKAVTDKVDTMIEEV